MSAIIRGGSVSFALAATVRASVHPRAATSQRESIGPLLARVRLEQGKSQLRLAEQLCSAAGVPTITRQEISRWEQEKRIPSRMWLPWLAMVLGLPLAELERAAVRARKQRMAYRRG